MPNGRTHSASLKGLESQVNCKHFFTDFEKKIPTVECHSMIV